MRPSSEYNDPSILPDRPAPHPSADRPREGRDWRRRLRAALAIAAVAVAALAGSIGALATFRQDEALPVATVRLSVQLDEPGALGIYVPLVDWGVRFGAVRLPVQLRIDVRRVDREAVERIARNRQVDVDAVRAAATDAIKRYLRALIVVVLVSALLAGVVVAFAVRSRSGPRLRWLLGTAGGTAVLATAAVALLLPPRGPLDDPTYFAHGADIPQALQAVETVNRSVGALSEELDAQLVGLARLMIAPGERGALPADGPRLTLVSDVHNNVLVLPTLERVAGGRPLFIAGDLTDRGTPLETSVTREIASIGRPTVFVTGNHDSETLERALARAGAVVLTRWGRLRADGSFGPMAVDVAGLRVAGYDDPFTRREPGRERGTRPEPRTSEQQEEEFAAWFAAIEDRVDVVIVHEPSLVEPVLRRLADDPPDHQIAFLVGHTHTQDLRAQRNVLLLNGGTAGGGGTGNLDENQPIGLAQLRYARDPFAPLAADLVTVDPGNGDATARHERLDLASATAPADEDDGDGNGGGSEEAGRSGGGERGGSGSAGAGGRTGGASEDEAGDGGGDERGLGREPAGAGAGPPG
ncbi:metallophosphoesterase family protein [Conexibacter arvalis]|uniref:Putative phosphodiesterase n=1 Tax=Conexibacter arvalis TaxID=912552 RepID=A0A840IGB1_9ACTN|nr:metallophosphoesterase [Conexibacter arvalis]MBB4662980.1 putative phosphodiesterase [Conexibacter arvalis]